MVPARSHKPNDAGSIPVPATKINNMNISFDHAKWLKEIGVNIETDDMFVPYYIDDVNNIEEHQIKNRSSIYFGDAGIELQEDEYMAYHIWDFIEWLRDNRNIWVWIKPYKDHAADNNDPFQHQLNILCKGRHIFREYNSPTEAYNGILDTIKEMKLL
jgi:hypothetical protein